MVIDFKKFLNKQSIIQLTLYKVIFSVFVFLFIFLFLYGHNFWEKQKLQFDNNLLLYASNLQSKIQSRISIIEEIKRDENLVKDQKLLQIRNIIQPIIEEDKSFIIGYYDFDLGLTVKSQNNDQSNISFEEISSFIGSPTVKFNELLKNNNVTNVNNPIFNNQKLVGYVWVYAKTVDFVFESYNKLNQIFILVLSLSVMIIFFLRKQIKQIEFYLNKFCQIIINNDVGYKQEQGCILNKLPELKPVLFRIASYTDDLRQINLELKSAKLRLTEIMEGISDGFFALNQCWEFTFANNETQRIMNADKIELVGKRIWEVLPQAIGSLTYDKMYEAMSQDKAIYWEDKGFTMTDRFYEYHAYPFDEGLSVFFRDITELKQQHYEYARLEKLNLIGQLAAGISHEIRNPLTTVKGFLQIFSSRPKYVQDKEKFKLMISEINRANSIITDFLSLSKANLDNTKRQNINEVINKIFPLLQADAFNSNKEVILNLHQLPEIIINESEIKQLILNLVRNGLEVTPEFGKVMINTYLKGNKVVLAVQDQGIKIPQEIQDKMGTPFFTTKETGTGLGLAISIGIAQRHKATFEFESDNSGTTFKIAFPIVDSSGEEVPNNQ